MERCILRKRIGIVLFVAFALVLLGTGILSAAGSENEGSVNTVTILPVAGSNVLMTLMNPFEVGGNIGMVALSSSSGDLLGRQLFPGEKIAEGTIRISNVSPFDYGAYVRAEPQEVPSKTWLYFEVKVWVGDTLFHSPKNIPAGRTVELRVEVFVPYGTPASSFQGLSVIVNAGPPPTETIAEGPASGCG